MGKRKSARKPQGPKKREALPTVFTCLFCNHEKSVSIKIDKKALVGYLECKVCGQKFQSATNALSAPVDVYGDWVDAADAVAKDNAHDKPSPGGRGIRQQDEDEDRYEGEGIVADDEYD